MWGQAIHAVDDFFSLSELTVGDIPHGFVDKVLRIFYII